MPISEEKVLDALHRVEDPELMINIVDLGLIYDVGVDDREGVSDLHILMTMTTPGCPYAPELVEEVTETLRKTDGVGQVTVEVTLSPPWTPDRMTEDARDQLGIF